MIGWLFFTLQFRDRVAVAPIPTPTQGLAALRAGATLG